nr:reverse transcriptase domain-containing protein [Tanacetum cinerariifolium]
MADQRTMAELLRAPTEGYAEAIVVPLILADQFELKHSLLNMMTTYQFFELEKDNPHDHIRAARRWLEKEPLRSIHTWEDLVSKFINELFPPQEQQFSVMKSPIFNNDTFYNALNPADQDCLNAAVGGSMLERRTQDVLTIIENKSKVRNSQNKSVVSQVKSCDVNSKSSSEIAKLTHAVNQQTSDVTTAMTAILKQFQATPPPAFVKAVEETCVTCGDAVNYNQGDSGYRPPGSRSLPRNTVANPKGELKAITTRSGIVIDGPTVPTPPTIINPEEDERVEETLTDPDLADYTIKVPHPPVQKYKPPSQREYAVHQRDLLHPNIPYPSRMLKQKQQEKDEVQIHKFCDPRVPLILGRPFLQTARALIDIYGEKIILRDGDERLTLNMRHDTSSYSNQPQKESINLINVFNHSSEDFLEDLFSNQPSGNPTFSSHLELTLPEVQDDIFDLEGGNVLPKKLQILIPPKISIPLFMSIH